MINCKNCGAELVENAVFCHKCGSKVEIITNLNSDDFLKQYEENNNKKNELNLYENLDNGKKFIFKDRVLYYSKELIRVNDIRKFFAEKALYNESNFRSFFRDLTYRENNIYEPYEILEMTNNRFNDMVWDSVEDAIWVLMDYGIDEISEESFYDSNFDLFDSSSYFEGYYVLLEHIKNFATGYFVEKQNERANRGRWVGGGFGVKGAIKGALTAGFLNVATDTIRGIGDKIKDTRDINKIKTVIDEVLRNPDLSNNLIKGLYNCTFNVYYALMHTLIKLKKINYDIFDDRLNANINRLKSRSSNLKKQYDRNIISKEDYINSLFDYIQIDPFNEDMYWELFCEDKDEMEKVLFISKYFGCQGQVLDSLVEEKESLIYKLSEEKVKKLEQFDEIIEEINSLKHYFKIEFVDSLVNDEINFEAEIKKIKEAKENFIYDSVSRLPENSSNEVEIKIIEFNKIKNSKNAEKLEQKVKKLEETKIKLLEKEKQIEEAKKRKKEIEDAVNLAKIRITDIGKALKKRDFNYIYSEIDIGNSYAEYALEQYYLNNVFGDIIELFAEEQMYEILTNLKHGDNAKHPFTKYIFSLIGYKMYSKDIYKDFYLGHPTDKEHIYEPRNAEKANIFFENMFKAAQQKVLSASVRIALMNINNSQVKNDSLEILELAAECQFPTAMAYLGKYYSCGIYVKKNIQKAEYLLTIAKEYGHPLAIEEFQKF